MRNNSRDDDYRNTNADGLKPIVRMIFQNKLNFMSKIKAIARVLFLMKGKLTK